MRLELLDRLIRVQEDERKRVARELHDNTSQALASLLMSLKLLESDRGPDDTRRLTADLRAAVDDVISRVHDLAWELRPSLLDSLGLVAAVQSLVEESARRLGLLVDLEVAGLEHSRFRPDVELAAFRIVQESLTNVAKHSGSSRASVVLQRRDGTLVVVIEDEGRGFDYEQMAGSALFERHLGLFGMSERATLVQGRLSVDSVPGRGTTIIAEIPLEAT
jgi:signal transduction histidine kinase